MLMFRINRQLLQNKLKHRNYYSTSTVSVKNEYTETPQYPEILDLSIEKRKEREMQAIHEEIKAVKTVEEKQIKINMPKYYGFICYMFHENTIPYDNLHLAQHVTRTHLIEQDHLPTFYNSFDVDSVVQDIRQDIEEVLLLEHDGYSKNSEIQKENIDRKEAENYKSFCLSRQINRVLLNSLKTKFSHFLNTQIDIEPRIESSWYAGGMAPPNYLKKWRESIEWLKHRADEPKDRIIQYIGSPMLALRSDLPLPSILPLSEAENPTLEVPYFKYNPRVASIFSERRRIVNIPGFWPGDTHQFGLVSYHGRSHMIERHYRDSQDDKEALHRQGILASFGWLNAQANFLGFTTFNDITYPLVTQTIITNGQLWSFYVYQLNTLLMHSNNTQENPKRNICWATKELKLFEEIKDGKIIGFNDDVLKMLIKFYFNAPQDRQGIELRPYLSNNEQIIADYEDDAKRQWLEKEYKFITSNRPRYYLPYEIYNWEKIYKIDHKTRPMDARRRPFELFIDPWKRRYDDRQAAYIPRKHRPDVKRHVGRYAKEYFP